MKSIRNLVCTVLMTMAMAVAMDDEASELDRDGDRFVGGVTNTSTVDPIERVATDGEEGTRHGCGRLGCPGYPDCGVGPIADFLANATSLTMITLSAEETRAFLNALLLRGATSTTSGGVVGEDAAEGNFEEGDADGGILTPQTTAPVTPADTTDSQQAPADDIGE